MNHPSRNPYNKILTLCILLLFSVYGKTFAYTEKLRIPPKSDIVREILVYDNNYNKLSNKFKNNAFGRYGTYYSNLLSEDEDIDEHLTVLNEIRVLYKSVQGCEFNNPALLNGLTLDEINVKIIQPAKKLANNETFGENQDTLIFMIFNTTCDSQNAFVNDLATDTFTCKKSNLSSFYFDFDEAFFEHYDNIILMQPNNGQSADKTLDILFSKLEKCIGDNARIDIAFMGHGNEKNNSVLLGSGNSLSENVHMDSSDFEPIENGGNSFAQSMKNIFIKSIDGGYKPRIIGIGCYSDFMQPAMNKLMPEEYINSVKVFGAPSASGGRTTLGFTKNSLQMVFYISLNSTKFFLIVDITDGNYKKTNNEDVDLFMIFPKSEEEIHDMHIFKQYVEENIETGWLTKPSGVSMQYVVREYNKNYRVPSRSDY